ncbi:hypothetical protein SASPL_136219 [Salvia splendens]|uniref:RING finger and CHY zinc finger domain-containing protein 1 n=1 Tax=Salvia splendens TaxID=180675 RepID=A0A8X8X196_SALSN|nr:hypothetical protein SASPL_136219 [Salvia splendens]
MQIHRVSMTHIANLILKQVIFPALDSQVKNVVRAYSLEHSSIDDSFSCVFHYLDLLINKEEDASQTLQELISSIVTVQTVICHHMHKEEEQIFPLLMDRCSPEEQSKLVWRYICSFPTMLLEEFLRWTTLYLTSYVKLDVLHCIQLMVPKERQLQEVLISWVQHRSSSSGPYSIYGKRHQLLDGLSNMDTLNREMLFNKASSIHDNSVEEPANGINIWHAALRRDLDQIVEELLHLICSNCSRSLSSVFVQLKFIVDVLIFYSNFLDKIFCNLSNHEAENSKLLWNPLIDECQIKALQRLLLYESRGSAQLENFVEMLYQELEPLVRGLGKNLMLLETECLPVCLEVSFVASVTSFIIIIQVFPSITTSFTDEMQMRLLQACFYMMPLGLLRCAVTWFSSHLTESQSKSIIKTVELGLHPAISKSFTSLLCQWIRIGYSGKSSAENFREDLEEMFHGRNFYLAKQNRQKTIFSDWMFNPSSTRRKIRTDFPSSSASEETGEMDIPMFFSQKFKRMPPLQRNLVEADHATSMTLEYRPMDAIFYFHRGLIKDLEYLVILSCKLAADVGFLSEFKKHFELLRTIYQIHSDSEDEIAFPALESKEALHNISQSYSLDHELGSKYFTKTSIILEEISELHDQQGSNETRARLDKLFLEIHRNCLSMCKVLCDHMYREEVEIFPLFRESFSVDEEEKIIGRMLGTMGAEMLKKVITWLMAHLITVEQQAMVSIWLKVAKNTKFDEWLREWWEGMAEHAVSRVEEGFRPPDAPMEVVSTYHNGDIPGQVPSYRDPLGETFGCKHYKRNCKLLTPCCDKLYTCIRCHDEQTDHSVDRKAVTEMMCMKCMVIQPIGQKCMSQSCNGFSMGSYYCRICKLFDDERQIYHCPYCNICRVGMGLGIDYFHCMKCNGCMGKALVVHTCREKRMEDNCPVCKECIFASYTALKALPCGHVMHSSCFQNYICSDYTCPSCSKSLGDMQVFFGMLDSMLAEAKIPEEYSGRTQVILCNDCEQNGTASFHWLYHKCSNCGSYNTRMLGDVLKSML